MVSEFLSKSLDTLHYSCNAKSIMVRTAHFSQLAIASHGRQLHI